VRKRVLGRGGSQGGGRRQPDDTKPGWEKREGGGRDGQLYTIIKSLILGVVKGGGG